MPYNGDLERLTPFRLANYREQLVVSVGHLLYRLGMALPVDPSGGGRV
jgi:hypothetical protein